MSDFWEGYEPEPTRPAPMTKDELTEPLGCVVVRPLLANSTTPPAQPAPVQEPVALPCCGYTDASAIKWNPFNGVVQCHNCGQTYTPPAAQRQWVGLTEQERNDIEDYCEMIIGKPAFEAIEAKLKEKNNG